MEKNLFEEDSPPNNVLEVGIPDDLRNFSTRGKLEMRLTTVRYPARESRIIDAALVRVAAIVVVVDVIDTIEGYAGSAAAVCSSASREFFFLQTTLSYELGVFFIMMMISTSMMLNQGSSVHTMYWQWHVCGTAAQSVCVDWR